MPLRASNLRLPVTLLTWLGFINGLRGKIDSNSTSIRIKHTVQSFPHKLCLIVSGHRDVFLFTHFLAVAPRSHVIASALGPIPDAGYWLKVMLMLTLAFYSLDLLLIFILRFQTLSIHHCLMDTHTHWPVIKLTLASL